MWKTSRLVFLSLLLLFLLLGGWMSLVGYHYHRGADLPGAIVMTFDDAQVAAACIDKPGRLRDFVARPGDFELGPDTSRFAQEFCD